MDLYNKVLLCVFPATDRTFFYHPTGQLSPEGTPKKEKIRMANNTAAETHVGIDQLIAAATDGTLRALEARKISQNVALKNGFNVEILIRCGGIPPFPLGLQTGGTNQE